MQTQQVIPSTRRASLLGIIAVVLIVAFQNCGGEGTGTNGKNNTSCMLGTQTVANGSTVIGYREGSVAPGQTCVSESRTCTNGILSGSYDHPTCQSATTNDCSFDGMVVTNGTSVIAFERETISSGQACNSETRMCTNGSLSGSYMYRACQTANNIGNFNINLTVPASHPQADAAITQLRAELEEALRLNYKFGDLRTNFWITDAKWQGSAATYHPSDAWLRANGMDVRMAKGVEIINIASFLAWNVPEDQPLMILHELTHAYHDNIMGANNERIKAAYQNAVNTKIYESVRYRTPNGPLMRAYALTNDFEYFAEITEAYFGANDYYPFNRADLLAHDPTGYNLCLSIWGP